MFEERDVNWNIALQKLNLFHREFFEPSLPQGWKKEVQNHGDTAPPQQQAGSAGGKPLGRRRVTASEGRCGYEDYEG